MAQLDEDTLWCNTEHDVFENTMMCAHKLGFYLDNEPLESVAMCVAVPTCILFASRWWERKQKGKAQKYG